MADSKDLVFASTILDNLYHLQEDCQYTDVTLTAAGGFTVQAHKAVLASASPYFAAMFSTGMKEAITSEVTLQYIQSSTLVALIRYMYTSDIELSEENVVDVVKACDMFQLERLKSKCELYMVEGVDAANALSLFNLASTYRLDELKRMAVKTMLTKFAQVIKCNEFLELGKEAVVEYLKLDSIFVPNEDVIFHAVLSWMKHDIEKRKGDFDFFLPHIRMGYCTNAYLSTLIEEEELISASHHQAILVKHICSSVTGRSMELSYKPRSMYSVNEQSMFVFGGKADGAFNAMNNDFIWQLSLKMHSIDLQDKDWIQFKLQNYLEDSSMRTMVSWNGISACTHNQKIIFTGTDGLGFFETSKCGIFDVASQKWTVHTGPQHGRIEHSSLAMNGCVYVLGGQSKREVDGELYDIKVVECMDLNTKKWREVEELPVQVRLPLVCASNMCIYLIGGSGVQDNESVEYKHTFMYNSVLDDWETKAQMPIHLSNGNAIVHKKHVYVFGGQSDFLSYNPSTDTWVTLASPHFSHKMGSAVLLDRRIWLLGGMRPANNGENKRTTKIETYDFECKTWSVSGLKLPCGLAGHQAVSVTFSSFPQTVFQMPEVQGLSLG